MKHSLLVAAMLAVGLSACGKKTETPAEESLPAIEASAPAADASSPAFMPASVEASAPAADASEAK